MEQSNFAISALKQREASSYRGLSFLKLKLWSKSILFTCEKKVCYRVLNLESMFLFLVYYLKNSSHWMMSKGPSFGFQLNFSHVKVLENFMKNEIKINLRATHVFCLYMVFS